MIRPSCLKILYQSLIGNSKTVNAAKLLYILGFLDPAGVSKSELHSAHELRHGRIREELLEHVNLLREDMNFKRSVDTLIALSLVESTTVGKVLNVHPLVRKWIRVRPRYEADGIWLSTELVTLSYAVTLQTAASTSFYDDQEV